MNHDASPLRRTLLFGVVVLAVVGALVVLRRPLLMAAPRCFALEWQGCLTTENGVVLVTLLTVPLSLLVVWALAWWRRAVGFAAAWRTSLAEVGMVHGTVPLVWMTLMPGENAGLVDGRLSLVPLRDLITMGPLGIVANLLIFAALGFFAPMRFTALTSVVRVFALGAACSILIETAQYVLRLDRVSSVDDVLLNAAGAALAALASRRWWRVAAEHPVPVSPVSIKQLTLPKKW
ncbi:VanZ family protein, partial [Umezawaea sp. NPDC059074]|uniref:VanZ family protein n=1 Tax=Umezawaea sp. NPDC059074 TaxID=3346716 RepID=UPI0036C92E70